MKKIVFALSCILLFHFTSWAEHKCPEDKISIPVGSLFTDPVSKSLRKTLDAYAQREGQPDAMLDSLGIRPYLPLFREKFIVLQISRGPFGGYWVNVILSTQKMAPLLMWVYDIGENEYEIRSLEKINLNKSDRKSWEPLRSKEFIGYWL